MEKVLAFFISGFFSFRSFGGGGLLISLPSLNLLESPKFLAFFKSLFFGVES